MCWISDLQILPQILPRYIWVTYTQINIEISCFERGWPCERENTYVRNGPVLLNSIQAMALPPFKQKSSYLCTSTNVGPFNSITTFCSRNYGSNSTFWIALTYTCANIGTGSVFWPVRISGSILSVFNLLLHWRSIRQWHSKRIGGGQSQPSAACSSWMPLLEADLASLQAQ